MRTVALSKVAKIDRTVATDDECRTLPYIGLEHIEKDTGHFTDDFEPAPLNMLATNFRFTPKHVLYGKLRPYLNKVVLPSFNGVCTTEILPILPNSNELDRTFLWAILLSTTFVSWATSQVSGANLPRLDPKLLAEYKIPLPPLPEQRRIAAILSKADRLRRLRRTARQLGETYLQSVFVEMFGEPVRNPKGWDKCYLSELCQPNNGIKAGPFGSSLKKEIYSISGYRIYGQEQVIGGSFEIGDYYISKEMFESDFKSYEVKPNDVLISLVGTFGKTIVVPESIEPGIINPRLLKISPLKEKLNSVFLAQYLQLSSVQAQLADMSHGGTMGILNAGQLKELKIVVPPLSDQERYAAIVQRYNHLLAQQHEAERQAEMLFQSLLQRAFQGEL